MTKTTYWVADAEGTRASVEGADERDRMLHTDDWFESSEPDRLDFVWLRHEDPALGAVRMTWEAAQLPAWVARGWTPGLPSGPAKNPAPADEVAEPVKPIKAPAAAGGEKSRE